MDPKVLANPFPWQRPFWNLIFLCNVPKAPVECVRLHSIVTFDRVCTWAFQLLNLTQSFQRIWDFNVSITCKTFQKANPGAWSLLDIICASYGQSSSNHGLDKEKFKHSLDKSPSSLVGLLVPKTRLPAALGSNASGAVCVCLCRLKGGVQYMFCSIIFFWYEKTQKTMATIDTYIVNTKLSREHFTVGVLVFQQKVWWLKRLLDWIMY